MTDGPILVMAGYVLLGAVVVNLLLPRDGWTARRLPRPYRTIMRQGVLAVGGILALQTVFVIEWITGGGRVPADGLTARLLGRPYRTVMWRVLILLMGVVAWPVFLLQEWIEWLLRLRGDGGGSRTQRQ